MALNLELTSPTFNHTRAIGSGGQESVANLDCAGKRSADGAFGRG